MFEFDDKITLGIFVGVISNIIRNIVGFICYYLGIQEYHIWQFATSAYLDIAKTKSLGIIIGMITDYIIATIIGVASVYFLLFVSFKNYILKGLFIGGAAWTFIFTIVIRTKISSINPNSAIGILYFIFNHMLLGILIVIFLKKFGKNVYHGH